MNRLIIIGNGFDIAHGLKTKYNDYIKHYWSQIKDSSYKDDFFEFKIPGYLLESCDSLKSTIEYFDSRSVTIKKTFGSIHFTHNKQEAINVLNEFFCRLNEKYDQANWVDIEMEYYASLKRVLNREHTKSQTEDEYETESYCKILRLNNEIARIAVEFDKYLKTQIIPEIDRCFNPSMEELFENDELFETDLKRFFSEFPKNYVDKELSQEFEKKKKNNESIKRFEQTFVLNFNYTNTILHYLRMSKASIISIHGEVRNSKNPINLGFGDERDKFYSTIEDHNENEYLRFIKSFYYSNNNNYKTLFDFVEESQFQVQIMGHSCGLSDRTLLNAIFENRNCKSIKVFYHEYSEINSAGQNDNYSEIVRNISRHFNQKTMMRDKIVNKTLSRNLPQLGAF
jgi:hypothetical protein